MKSNNVKRLLAATLAATMMMASALTAAAASGGSSGSSSSSDSESSSNREETTQTVVATPEEVAAQRDAAEAASAAAEAERITEAVAEALQVRGADAKMTVAGSLVQTTVSGAYATKSVQGVAVTTPAADVKANLGLTGKQTPYIMAFDTNPKKSSLAMECVNATAEALGGTSVATINVDLAAKENGKLVTLSSGSVGMVVGLPKGADTDKTYSVVCVQPGGVVTVLEDTDASPATVTFEVKAGLGTYGIIAK